MLFKHQDKVSGKTLYRTKSLLLKAKQGYTRPPPGKVWFNTTTTVWKVDELIRRSVRDWRRLTNETGHTGTRAETMRADHDSVYTGTNSVFPAPLVEWILLRYAPPGGKILDAFAGGPPRAVVSSIMGYEYTGVEIRQEQIDENKAVLKELALGGSVYIHADSRFIATHPSLDVNSFDMALTCPPYYDLEQYSDLDADLSNASSYWEFNAGMSMCAHSHYPLMKPGAFVCIVVGPFRDKKTGELIDFPAHTVENFRDSGFIYWQQIVLSKNFASAAKRSTNAWKGHKLVPAHEFLLVFRKPENG
jgi:DNA modification methylase